MTFAVQVKVMPLKELLDPQGKAVMGGLGNLGLNAIQDVRIGKNISLQVEANLQMKPAPLLSRQQKNYWPTLLWSNSR